MYSINKNASTYRGFHLLKLIESLQWLTMKEMIVFETATTVYKSLHGSAATNVYQIVGKWFTVSP